MQIIFFEESLRTGFVETFQRTVAPYYQRVSLIEQGNPLGAVSMKPSGIWEATEYALALKQLGRTEIPINGTPTPARTLYDHLRKEQTFCHRLGSKTYWEAVPNPDSFTKKSFSLLQLKQNVSPAKAFKSFLEQLSFIDCDLIIDLSMVLFLIERFGEESFDRVVQSHHKGPIQIGSLAHNPIRTLFLQAPSDSNPSVGQCYYVENHSDYSTKHPHGPLQGFNLIYIGNNERGELLFIGFGLNPKGLTLREVAQILLDGYNKEPITPSDLVEEENAAQFLSSLQMKITIGNETKTVYIRELQKLAAQAHSQAVDILTNFLEKTTTLQTQKLTFEEFFPP